MCQGRHGNAIVKATIFLMLLAACRDVRAAMENPVHSSMFRYHLVTQVETILGMVSAIAYRCAYSSAPYGRRYLKGYKFLATGKWIRGVAAKCQCPGGIHLSLVITKKGPDGKRHVTGIKKRLHESGAYPLALGRKIVACATPGRPLQPGDGPDNSTIQANRSTPRSRRNLVPGAVQHYVSSTRASQVKKTKTKKHARADVQRPASSTAHCPASSVSALPWLQPSATSAGMSGRPKRGPKAKQPAWCMPLATSMARRRSDQPSWCTPVATSTAAASMPQQSSSVQCPATPLWLCPRTEG